MKKYKAQVLVRLRASVSDAAGNAVKQNVDRICDIKETSLVRLGKVIDMEFEAPNTEHAEREMKKLTDGLLANTIIEDWQFQLQEVS